MTRSMHVLTSFVAGALTLLSGLFAAPSSVAAEQQGRRIMVVLDASGSMSAAAGQGLSRLDGARNALDLLVESLPANAQVGVRVFGATYAGMNRSISCRDTQEVLPVGSHSPSKVAAAVQKLKPVGDTPISLALKYAAADLQKSSGGPATIVLISDGEDICSPPDTPPCDVVRGLRESGVEVRIETIGIALEGNASAARDLQCVAEESGGNFFRTGDATGISAAVERITGGGRFDLGKGKPAEGAATAAKAKEVEPGTWNFRIAPGDEKWFAFKAPKGSRPRVLSTVRSVKRIRVPRNVGECTGWRAQLYNPFQEGGVFPPYLGEGTFVGAGLGTAGATTNERLQRYSEGIDFPGSWKVRFSLRGEGADENCLEHLPEGAPFEARFSLSLGSKANSVAASPSPTQVESPVVGDDPELSSKYNDPATPSESSSWQGPLFAALLASSAVGLAIWLIRARQRRARGW